MDPYLYCLVRPRAPTLSVCMYDCLYETPCGLVVCVPLPGTDESEQRGNSVVARRAGRPRSARLAHATRHLPQILRSSFQAVPRAEHLRPRRPARRPALGPAYPSGVCTPPHAASPATPPMPRPAGHTRARSPRVRRGAQWGGKAGNPPHAADVSRRAPSHASARPDRPDMYACQLVRALRRGFLWAGAGGPCRLRLAPEGRTWHPSIHNFALSGKSSQRQVSTCSGRARAPPPGHS